MAGRTMRRWTQVGIGATAGALTVGAALALPADAPLGPPVAAAATALQRFDDCDAVTAWYVKQALPKVTAWGLGGPPIYYEFAMARDVATTAAAPELGAVSAGAVGSSASGTNVQEQGVDEPDIAKLMGELVISIHDHQLVVTDVSGSEPEVIGTLDLPERWNYELLIVGDRAVVTGTRYSSVGWGGDVIPTFGRETMPYWGSDDAVDHSSLTTVDLSDPKAPEVVNRDVVEGSIATSRAYDGTIRIVTTNTPQFDFVYPHGELSNSEAQEKNREIVRASVASDWLPWRSFDHRGNGGQPLVDCGALAHPSDGAGLGTITVLTMDPENPSAFGTTAVAADGSLVYASQDRLYVATLSGGFTAWGLMDARVDDDDWRNPDTEIHAFSTEGADTTYVASGSVEGVTNDRWAFSEYEGMLRVATSLGSTWSPKESVVTVLREDGTSLEPVGKVGGIGANEEIKAVRWFGDYAVVVTFRQVDPLYLLDLSNAAQPTIVGELKVPGFSSYLHPVGGDVILGVGQQSAWGSSQVSSFDLTDLKRIDMLPFDHAGHTPVADDSRAFTYLPDQRIALIPTDSWGRSSARLQIVSVAEDGSLTPVSSVAVTGWGNEVRTLPLGSDRVALVGGGEVVQIITTP